MRTASTSSPRLVRATAVLLLLAFVLPTGLHAKAFVEFCTLEMVPSTHLPVDQMKEDHSCCLPNEASTVPSEDSTHHSDCEWNWICACNIGQHLLSSSDGLVSSHEMDARIAVRDRLEDTPVLSDPPFGSQNSLLALHDPPLWLLYDTLLN